MQYLSQPIEHQFCSSLASKCL